MENRQIIELAKANLEIDLRLSELAKDSENNQENIAYLKAKKMTIIEKMQKYREARNNNKIYNYITKKEGDIPTVLVTGAATNGTGQAVTKLLLDKEIRVIGTYKPEDKELAHEFMKKNTKKELLTMYPVDFSDGKEVEDFYRKLKTSIHSIINAEFYFDMEDPFKSEEAYQVSEKVMKANCAYVLPFIYYIKENNMPEGGAVVMVTSAEIQRQSYGAPTYSAAKAGIHGMVEDKNIDWVIDNNIYLNAVAAGFVGGIMGDDEVFDVAKQYMPGGKLVDPDEVANLIFSFVGGGNRNVSGAIVYADGGYYRTDPQAKSEFDQFMKERYGEEYNPQTMQLKSKEQETASTALEEPE